MRRFVFGFVACGLVVSACSGSSGVAESSSPVEDSTSAAGPEETVESTETTVDDFYGFIDGEPPSTTVSDDPDEQAAADAMYWMNEFYVDCEADPQSCVVDDFAETTTGESLEAFTSNFDEFKRLGATAKVPEQSHEFTIFWSRSSETSDGLVAVFSCYWYPNQLLKADGSPWFDKTDYRASLELNLMVEGDDGRWRMTDFTTVRQTVFAEDEEGVCSNFDGTEISDEEVAAYLS